VSRLHSLRTWYTLGDALRRLTHRLDEAVHVDDFLCVLAEGQIPVHFRPAGGVAPLRQVIRACAWPGNALAKQVQHHFVSAGVGIEYLHGTMPVEYVSVTAATRLVGFSPALGRDGLTFSGAAYESDGQIAITPCVVVSNASGLLFQVLTASPNGGNELSPLHLHADGPELLLLADDLQRIEERAIAHSPDPAKDSSVATELLGRRHLEQAAALAESGPTRPVSRQEYQEELILSTLRELGFDPLAIPPSSPSAPGAKAAARDAIGTEFTKKVFDFAWERLRKDGRIANRSASPPSTRP